MTKEEIIIKLDELEAERVQIISEQEAIDYARSLSISDCSSRTEELAHALNRRQRALDSRKKRWEYALAQIEKEAEKVAA